MRLSIVTIGKDLKYAYGQDLVFSYLPRYIEGHLVWLEHVWMHYQYQYKDDLIFPRTLKVCIKYSLFSK